MFIIMIEVTYGNDRAWGVRKYGFAFALTINFSFDLA